MRRILLRTIASHLVVVLAVVIAVYAAGLQLAPVFLDGSPAGIPPFGDGSPLGEIPVPETVGNLCFAGDGTLYIAATTSLYRIPTTTRGAA